MGSLFMRSADTLIRLGGRPGSSESSPGVQVILLVLWGGSFDIAKPYHPYHIQFYGCLATTKRLRIDGYFYC